MSKRAVSRPSPASPPRRFVVHRHHARRLHYDLRLEIYGVLKSWAVPKGPTLDPGEKRLAVLVEDHPLDYGDFEGNISPGEYGAGSVMVWDAGTYETIGPGSPEEQFDRGDLKLVFHGVKLKGEFALVRMKGRGNDWLLIKKRDAFAQPGWDPNELNWSVLTGRTQEEIAAEVPPRAGFPQRGPDPKPSSAPPAACAVPAPLPETVQPMLATAASSLPEEGDWLFEIKWDGVRALAFLRDGEVRLVSRRGTALTAQYPELGELGKLLRAREAVVDGEIVALDAEGRPDFSLLQPRILLSDPGRIRRLAASQPVRYYVFDLLYLDGFDLRGCPIEDRRRLLEERLTPGEFIRISETLEGDPESILQAARAQGLEGLIAKRAGSIYEGKRSSAWLKIKLGRRQDVVICGYTTGKRETFASLVTAVFTGGALRYAGCVGTGFDSKTARQLRQRLDQLRTNLPPVEVPAGLRKQVVWARPELVCTVRFQEWTPEGHLRSPVFLGLREDARPEDCIPETALPVQAPLVSGEKKQQAVVIEGRRLVLRNLEKLFFPTEGYRKSDVLNYYDAVAGLLLPFLRNRPVVLWRYPDGIGGPSFVQKQAPAGLPSWVQTEELAEEGGTKKRYVIINDRAALLALVNLACLEFHPWSSQLGALEQPEFLLIDLDPHQCTLARLLEAVERVRGTLQLIGLEAAVKWTGGEGFHLCVPLEPGYTFAQARQFAEILARWLAAAHPDRFTLERNPEARRPGTVYLDYAQNGRGKTAVAFFSLRGRPGAPVAVPVSAEELKHGFLPWEYTLRTVPARASQLASPIQAIWDRRQRLETALQKLEEIVRSHERLAIEPSPGRPK